MVPDLLSCEDQNQKNMPKRYGITLLAFMLFFQTAFSQAKESTGKLEGTEHPVFVSDYQYPADIVLGGIAQRLKEAGLSTRSRKGMITNKGVHLSALSSNPIDLYIEVENKGRKGQNGSMVSLFVSKGRDNFVGNTYDPELAANAIDFLNSLQYNVTQYALSQDIKKQQKELDQQSKDYKKETKRIRKLQSKKQDKQNELNRERDAGKMRKISHKINKLDKDILSKGLKLDGIQRKISTSKERLRVLNSQVERNASQNQREVGS